MGLMKKLTSAVVASSLILGAVGAASAAFDEPGRQAAAKRMFDLKLVTGRDGGDLALDANITRAELVTVFVRAFGQDNTAKLLVGAPSFPDAQNHPWASGYIALAKNIVEQKGDTLGLPDGTFNPNANITVAEALTLMCKFLGVKPDTTKSWPDSYFSAAVNAGLISSDDAALLTSIKGTAANRGLVFYFADQGFYGYDLGAGKTVYTSYVDNVAPELTVDSTPATTTAAKVTITGSAKDATAVWVADKAATLTEGKFTADVELQLGKDNAIVITAKDLAGNSATKTVTIARAAGDVASIEASDLTVVAGESVDLGAVAKDKDGNPTGAAVSGESTLGTVADGKFTAGTKAGTGTITLKVGEVSKTINVTVKAGALASVTTDKASAAPGSIVTLIAKDAHGNTITEGVTFSQSSADAMLTGDKFMASKAGSYKVTATSGETTVEYTVGIYDSTVAKFGVTAAASNLVANNASEIDVTIKALDANGNLIANSTAIFKWDALTAAAFEIKDANGDFVAIDLATPANDTVTLKDGVKTVTLRSKAGVLGGQIATIKGALSTDAAKTGSTTVEFVDQVATSVKVSTDDKFVANNAGNENATFAVEILDQAGKVMTSGAYAVKVTVTGPAVLVDDATDANAATEKNLVFTAGTDLNTFVRSKLGEAGTVTVTATAEGLGTSSATVSAVAAQAASKLQISADKTSVVADAANSADKVTYTLRITDAQGVPVAVEPGTVSAKLTIDDDYMGEVAFSQYAAADDESMTAATTLTAHGSKEIALNFLPNGTAKLVLDSQAFVGDLKVTFVDSAASPLAGGDSTVTFVANTATKVGLERSNTINVAAASPTSKLTAQLYDAAGNAAKVAGKKITFSSASDDVKLNGGGKTVDVLTDAEGKATVDVSVLGYVGNTYTVTVTGASGSGITNFADGTEDVVIAPVNTVASTISASVYNVNGNLTSVATSNDVLTLKVTAKDANGKVLTGEAISVEVTEGKTVAAVTVVDDGTVPGDTANDGVYTGTFSPKTAGRLVLTVKDSSSASEIKTTATVSVRAAAYDHVVLQRADYTATGDTVKTSKGVAKLFRVVPVDANNNVSAKTSAATTVTVTVDLTDLGAGEYFEIRSTEGGANLINAGTGVATFTLPAGSTGVSFYVLSNDTAGVNVTVSDGANPDRTLNIVAE